MLNLQYTIGIKMDEKKTYQDALEEVLAIIKKAKERESGDVLSDLEMDVIRLLEKSES